MDVGGEQAKVGDVGRRSAVGAAGQLGVAVDGLAVRRSRRPVVVLQVAVGTVARRRHLVLGPVQEYLQQRLKRL